MSFGNISLETLLTLPGFSKIADDFGDFSLPEALNQLSLKDFIRDFGSLYQTFRDFYTGNENIYSQGYVRDFIAFIQTLDTHEYQENTEKRTLRNYQKSFILDCLKFLIQDKQNAGYIHSATSTGKTVVFGEIVRHIHMLSPASKVLIVVSGKEALSRARKEFEELCIDTGVYHSREKNLSHTITLITRQSLIRSGKEAINPQGVSLMICDEIHDGFLGEISKEVLGRFPCKKIGFTATPELRNKHVEELFQKNIGQYLIDEAQKDGYLPQIDTTHTFELPDSYFSVLKKQGDDYSESSLNHFEVDHIFPQVLEFLKKGAGKGKQFALFMPSVAASERVTRYLQAGGVKIAHLDGDSSDDEVNQAKEDFEAGRIQVITSCDKMTQSWDSDAIDGVINLRPTLSPSKYFQIIGRALHGKEEVEGNMLPKSEVMVVDLVNSKESYRSRTITASGLKKVLGETQKGTKPRKEIISRTHSEIIREIEMYFDIPDFSISEISKILTNFRETCHIEKRVFYTELQENIFFYDTEVERTISVDIISNSALGKSYSGRTRSIELSLGIFLSLVKKQYKNLSKLLEKIQKQKTNYEQEQEILRNYNIVDLIDDLFPFFGLDGLLESLHIQSGKRGQDFVIDTSDLIHAEKVRITQREIKKGFGKEKSIEAKQPYDVDIIGFLHRLEEIARELDKMNYDELRQMRELIQEAISQNLGNDTLKGKNYDQSVFKNNSDAQAKNIEDVLRRICKRIGIEVIGIQELAKAKEVLYANIMRSISMHPGAMKELIGFEYDENTGEGLYSEKDMEDSRLNQLQRYVSFFSTFINGWEFRQDTSLSFLNEIDTILKESLDAFDSNTSSQKIHTIAFHEKRLQMLLEKIFEFIDIPLRNRDYFPLTLEEVKQGFFSKKWKSFLQELKIFPGENYLDFSGLAEGTRKGDIDRLYKLLGYIHSGFSLEEKEKLKAEGVNFSKGRFYPQKVLSAFCEKMGIEYTSKEIFKKNQEEMSHPDILFSDLGIHELENIGVIVNKNQKTLDFSKIKGLSTAKIFRIPIKTYLQKLIGTLGETEKQKLEKNIGTYGITNKDTNAITRILLSFGEKYGWRSIERFQEEQKIFPLLENIQKSFGGNRDEKIIALGDIIQSGKFQIRKRRRSSFGAAPTYTGEEIYIQESGKYFLIIDWENHKIKFGEVIKHIVQDELNPQENIFGNNILIQNNCFDNNGNIGFIGRISIEI